MVAYPMYNLHYSETELDMLLMRKNLVTDRLLYNMEIGEYLLPFRKFKPLDSMLTRSNMMHDLRPNQMRKTRLEIVRQHRVVLLGLGRATDENHLPVPRW